MAGGFDTEGMQDAHAGPKQFYIEPAQAPEEGMHYYRLFLVYNNIPLANIHAYRIVHLLKRIAQDIFFYPDDILKNSDSAKEILENGFNILIRTKSSEADLRGMIREGYDVKKLYISECTKSEFDQGFDGNANDGLEPANMDDERMGAYSECNGCDRNKFIKENQYMGKSEMQELDTQLRKYVTFKSGGEYFAIKIQIVNEIIMLQAITEVPDSEGYFKGVINLRGKIVPVVDVRMRFRQEPIEYNDRTCIIVVSLKTSTVGLIVEKIAEVVEIDDENIIYSPTLGITERKQQEYIYGVGKIGDSVKLLLDPNKLFNEDELSIIENANNESKGDEISIEL